MVIACLGWGSLIWDPKGLPVQNTWFVDGPPLRVEFARQSANGRLTLVIEATAPEVRSPWTIMDLEDILGARQALMTREGTKTAANVANWSIGDKAPTTIPSLPAWAVAHGVDGVVWTALPARFGEANRAPTAEEALQYLGSLTGETRVEAEKYIRRAPRQIDTPYRRRIAAELGWEYTSVTDTVPSSNSTT